MLHWLACRVVTGKEYFVRKKIKDMAPFAEILVPRKYTKLLKNGAIKTRSERMLPGYLLIGTTEVLDRSELKNFVKVIGSVSESEISVLMAQEGQKEHELGVGLNILVIDGPFQGCKGKINKQNEDKTMNCRLVFQGMELMADMKADLLSSIDSAR
jgi:transcription antitermination factor NusG